VAVPTTVPSTLTCTLLTPVPTTAALSTAHPETVTVPDTADPCAGASM